MHFQYLEFRKLYTRFSWFPNSRFGHIWSGPKRSKIELHCRCPEACVPQHDSLPLEGSEVFDVAPVKTTAVTLHVSPTTCDLGSCSAELFTCVFDQRRCGVVRGGCGKHAELLPVSSWTVHLHIGGRSYSGMMTGHKNRYRLKPNNMVLHRKWICSPKDTRIIPYWRSVLHARWAFWARHQSRFKVCIDFLIIILYHHNSWL